MNEISKLAIELQSIGLNDKQAKVYLALLFLGPSRVSAVAKQAELKRPTTYIIIGELLAMGLVSESQEGKLKMVIAEPPSAIESFLDKQIAEFNRHKKELVSLAASLSALEEANPTNSPSVRFYRGKEGEAAATRYVRSHSREGSTIYGFGDIDEVINTQISKVKQNPGYRLSKGISSKVLYSSKAGNILSSDSKLLRTTKKLAFDVAADINLQEDFAVITTYEGDDRLQIIIESKPIVLALRQLHKMAWDNYEPKK